MLTRHHIATLRDMLSYCRPHGSDTERAFIYRYIAPAGATEDTYGNWRLSIGNSAVLWSSHTDTVHFCQGMQPVSTDGRTMRLSRRARKSSDCLGADDTVGVFLMLEMIRAGIPGHYVFHYGEEHGCIGSSALARHWPAEYSDVRCAIAFDRAGTTDVVTHQLGGRTCSDAFAVSLASSLDLPLTPARGVFTDTAEYVHIIDECTNLSVGYYSQHSPREYIDLDYLGKLLRAVLQFSADGLVYERTAGHDDGYDYVRAWDTPVVTSVHADTLWCFGCDRDEEECVCLEPLYDDDALFLRYLRGEYQDRRRRQPSSPRSLSRRRDLR